MNISAWFCQTISLGVLPGDRLLSMLQEAPLGDRLCSEKTAGLNPKSLKNPHYSTTNDEIAKVLTNSGQIYPRFVLASKWLRSGFVAFSCFHETTTKQHRIDPDFGVTQV